MSLLWQLHKWLAGVFSFSNYLLCFSLLHVERETVRHAGFGVVVLKGNFVWLEAAIACHLFAAVAQRLHFCRGHWREALCDAQVLLKDFQLFDACDGGGY